MRDSTTTPDGRGIALREPARGPHPRTNEQVAFKSVNQLLLADGETLIYECDRCGKVHARFQSVLAHLASHGDRAASQYDEKTLRAIATAVRRHWTEPNRWELAAQELNERQVPTARGGEWNNGLVRSTFNRHCVNIRVHIRRPKADPVDHVENEPVSAPPGAGTSGRLDPPRTPDPDRPYLPLAVTPAIETIRNELAVVAVEMERLMAHLWRIREAVGELQAADPELADKALRYDQMIAAIRPISQEGPRG